GRSIRMPRVAFPAGVGLNDFTICSVVGLSCACATGAARTSAIARTNRRPELIAASTAEIDHLHSPVARLGGLIGRRDQQAVRAHADRLQAGTIDMECAG